MIWGRWLWYATPSKSNEVIEIEVERVCITLYTVYTGVMGIRSACYMHPPWGSRDCDKWLEIYGHSRFHYRCHRMKAVWIWYGSCNGCTTSNNQHVNNLSFFIDFATRIPSFSWQHREESIIVVIYPSLSVVVNCKLHEWPFRPLDTICQSIMVHQCFWSTCLTNACPVIIGASATFSDPLAG